MNGHGPAGLSAALDFILETGVEEIHNKEIALMRRFICLSFFFFSCNPYIQVSLARLGAGFGSQSVYDYQPTVLRLLFGNSTAGLTVVSRKFLICTAGPTVVSRKTLICTVGRYLGRQF